MTQNQEITDSAYAELVVAARKQLEQGVNIADLLDQHKEEILRFKNLAKEKIFFVIHTLLQDNPDLLFTTGVDVTETTETRSGQSPSPVQRILARSALAGRNTPPVRLQEMTRRLEDPHKHLGEVRLKFFLEASPLTSLTREEFREKILIFIALLKLQPDDFDEYSLKEKYVIDTISFDINVFQSNANEARALKLEMSSPEELLSQYVQLVLESRDLKVEGQENPESIIREETILNTLDDNDDSCIELPLMWRPDVQSRVIPYSQRNEYEMGNAVLGIQIHELAVRPTHIFESSFFLTSKAQRIRKKRK